MGEEVLEMTSNQEGEKDMPKGIGEVTIKVGQILQGLDDEGYSLDDVLQVGVQLLSVIKARNEADAIIQVKEKALDEVMKKISQSVPNLNKREFAKAFAASPNFFNAAGN